MSADRPVVRRPNQVAGVEVGPGVTVREMLNDDHGCRGLHQRRLGVAAGARLAGTAPLIPNGPGLSPSRPGPRSGWNRAPGMTSGPTASSRCWP